MGTFFFDKIFGKSRTIITNFRKPSLEFLEDRLTPSISIQFDYSHDSGFFTNHQDRQSLLATAASVLTSRSIDRLAPIVPIPSLGDTSTAAFTDPSTGGTAQLDHLTGPANTITIFPATSPTG